MAGVQMASSYVSRPCCTRRAPFQKQMKSSSSGSRAPRRRVTNEASTAANSARCARRFRADMPCDNRFMTEETTPILSDAEKQEKILNALQAVLDPEIGLSVIDLDLIREVVFTPEEAEVKMVLTTPFCPYGTLPPN